MTREINGRIRMVVSNDRTRCAAECPRFAKGQAGWQDACRWDDGYHVVTHSRHPACIAAEQAAASVPSCEAWVPALRDRVQVTGCGTGTIVAIGTEGSALGMHRVRFDETGVIVSCIPRDRLVRLVERPAADDHLDGGARSLDASEALREAQRAGYLAGYRSTAADAAADEHEVRDHAEALREARVQGMREVQNVIAHYTYAIDAERAIDIAIEAVRKGER